MGKLPWPGWLWRKYEVVASPSQMASYGACHAQWWLRKIMRLPEDETQQQFAFGNAVHETAARWFNREELWPRGWRMSLSDWEAQLIQDMMALAVKTGAFDRERPLEGVERALHTELIPGKVALIGKLDVLTDKGVEDHKTLSSRDWMPTEAAIREDPKMMCYARMWQRETGRGEDSDVELTLNCLSKDARDPFAERVTAIVTADDVREWWDGTATPLATAMLLDAKKNRLGDVTKDESHRACRKYRGCPFLDVCMGNETIPEYRTRMKK